MGKRQMSDQTSTEGTQDLDLQLKLEEFPKIRSSSREKKKIGINKNRRLENERSLGNWSKKKIGKKEEIANAAQGRGDQSGGSGRG